MSEEEISSVTGHRRFRSYPKYKDSGVEWLSEIPAHWAVMKTAWLFSIGSGTTPRSEDPAYYGGETPWLTTSELRESVITSTEKNVTGEALRDFSSLKVHPTGSVVVAMYGATIGRLGILGIPATVNQACCVFSNPRGIDTWFWFYWLQMRRSHLISLGYGGGQPNLSQELLRSIRVTIPPQTEQLSISAFLDRETAKIDALIEKKERLIELLQEKRTALITQAVTRGLDPTVPMKESGIDWLGVIPAQWTIVKLKYAAPIQGGYAFKSDDFKGDGVPIVRMNNLRRGFLDLNDAARIDESKCLNDFSLKIGDLLLGMSGSLGETGSLGNYAIVRQDDLPCQLNQRVGRFNLKDNLKRDFLLYFIAATPFTEPIIAESTGTAQFNISPENVGSLAMGMPKIEEQRNIAAFLDRETAKIDELVAKVQEAIDRLKEYRTALISAAVTGKIDVRNLT